MTNADEGYGFGFDHPGRLDHRRHHRHGRREVDRQQRLSARRSACRRHGLELQRVQERSTSPRPRPVLVYGGTSDTWGRVWDPTQFGIELPARDPQSQWQQLRGCRRPPPSTGSPSRSRYTTMDAKTSNAVLSGTICKSGDFNFIIDMSGSIGAQGDIPSNLQQLKDGINGFVDAFEGQPGASGLLLRHTVQRQLGHDDHHAATSAAATFQTAVGNLTNPSGLTPTGLGISTGAGNDRERPRRRPERHVRPDRRLAEQAEHPQRRPHEPGHLAPGSERRHRRGRRRPDRGLRRRGRLSQHGDRPGRYEPAVLAAGDGSGPPLSWTRSAAATHFDADFTGFIDELFAAIDCPPPPPAHIHIDQGRQSGRPGHGRQPDRLRHHDLQHRPGRGRRRRGP